jgi:hypothetical protein
VTLGEKQRRFVRLIGRLIEWAYANGYELTFGDAYRTPAQAEANAAAGIGIAKSLHTQRLAVDFNLFREGVFLTASEDHRPLGEFWKSLAPDTRWGGDFSKPDGNHYSLEFEGRK